MEPGAMNFKERRKCYRYFFSLRQCGSQLHLMHPSQLSIKDFHYDLPEEKIAKFPLDERDASRLLIFKDGVINEGIYRNLPSFLPQNALLVFNNSRVIEARMLFKKPSGGVIEVFVLEPAPGYSDVSQAMHARGEVSWKCLIGGASKWKHGQVLQKQLSDEAGDYLLEAAITERLPGSFVIRFRWERKNVPFYLVLQKAGLIPLPPYLKRETTPADTERYQTIFASREGSVAAPTAALHFTQPLLDAIKAKGISVAQVTLHVGAGTFMPVKAPHMKDHLMHAEYIEVDLDFLSSLAARTGNIFPVGTTSLRTIESLYWMGVKCLVNPNINYEALMIKQWEVYDELSSFEVKSFDSLKALRGWMQRNGLEKLVISTQILIAPGYKFKLTSGLITNFHQPESTLLLLVAALTGEHWRDIYDYALKNNFRFLSYGDGCLLYAV
jgi:S-adenosylmethionine:tRNA ribosyltransferase-isomerase